MIPERFHVLALGPVVENGPAIEPDLIGQWPVKGVLQPPVAGRRPRNKPRMSTLGLELHSGDGLVIGNRRRRRGRCGESLNSDGSDSKPMRHLSRTRRGWGR